MTSRPGAAVHRFEGHWGVDCQHTYHSLPKGRCIDSAAQEGRGRLGSEEGGDGPLGLSKCDSIDEQIAAIRRPKSTVDPWIKVPIVLSTVVAVLVLLSGLNLNSTATENVSLNGTLQQDELSAQQNGIDPEVESLQDEELGSQGRGECTQGKHDGGPDGVASR
jgi:hypothetical protein